MTLTGKILYHHAIAPRRPWVEAGDLLRVRVDWTIASELAWNGMNRTYEELGRPTLADPDRFYLALDHTVDPVTLARDPRTQRLAQLARDFAKEAKLRYFYDANVTIMHTTFYRDLVRPGDLVLGADSHTSSHGGVGAFAIGLGGADVAVAMVLGETWIEVPEAIAVDYRGSLPFGIGGKDVILRTLGELGRNTVALERTVEFGGDAARGFSTDMRFTICNMTAEFGGLNGIFAPDGRVGELLGRRAEHRDGLFFAADPDAPYVARYPIDLARLGPQVAKPFAPDNVAAVEEVAGTALHGAFIGACTTTEEELVLGALVLERLLADGKRPVPAEGKRLVVPGNLEIAGRLREAGLLAAYEQAGFRVGPPGCSMCLGVASDRAGEGEVWLSSQNRNFENRMGRGSLAWLSSAATVAASALELRVADPRPVLERVDRARYDRLLGRTGAALPEVRRDQPAPSATAVTGAVGAATLGGDAAPARLRGAVQRFGDHVDTDAIIPGEFCHLTDVAELGARCFHHVRPEFAERARGGRAIVVAGEGWGSGSSREQAVWALKGAGIRAVVARSFAFIHKRNLVNEALPYMVVTDDRFYALATEGAELELDLGAGTVTALATGEVFRARPLSPMVQALAQHGGIVEAIRRHGPETFSRLQGGQSA
ncbi:MAG: 3-isopropylmalate dehydratase [Deltaproteobacteria bacterium]|nr:3-isopropylmalate dehydratase [Deltaproteobacteria bacterium]